MSKPKLDLTKPLRTVAEKRDAIYIGERDGTPWFAEWTGNEFETSCCLPGNIDEFFENVPERRTMSCWLNVYDHRIHNCTHSTKEVADRAAASTRIACIHITQDYEVGEGLNEKPEPPFDIEGDLYLKDSPNVTKHKAVKLNDGSYLVECYHDYQKRWVTAYSRVSLEYVKKYYTNKKPE